MSEVVSLCDQKALKTRRWTFPGGAGSVKCYSTIIHYYKYHLSYNEGPAKDGLPVSAQKAQSATTATGLVL